MTSPRIAFAGTPEFAVASLKALLAEGYSVSPVLTQPDRPTGRGRKMAPSPVKKLARESGITTLTPTSLRELRGGSSLGEAPDLMVVVAYGMILPTWLLEWPRAGCVNVHASLLPRWRGAAPIQRAIMAGDVETGVCVMQMEKGLDTGPVYSKAACPIGKHQTAGDLHDALADLGAKTLVRAIPGILDGSLVPQKQSSEGVTYAHKLEKSEALLDWRSSAPELERQVLAFNPWPVAETTLFSKRLRIWRAQSAPGRGSPGTIVAAAAHGIDVATGNGVLRLTELQLPGGKRMDATAFANGQPPLAGVRLGEPD